jgi:hypothetical protein
LEPTEKIDDPPPADDPGSLRCAAAISALTLAAVCILFFCSDAILDCVSIRGAFMESGFGVVEGV